MNTLLEHGYVVVDDFVSADIAAGVASLARTAIAHDPIRGLNAIAGEGGRDADGPPESQVFAWRTPMPRNARGDVTCWLGDYGGNTAVENAVLVAEVGAADAEVATNRTDDSLLSTLVDEGHGHWQPTAVGSETPTGDRSLQQACGDLQTLLARLRGVRSDLVACAAQGPQGARIRGTSEVQLAWYAPNGSGYKQHVDALPDDGESGAGGTQRKVTLIVYCNPGWTEAAGGQLRVHRLDIDGAGTTNIEPRAGRLVAFLAGCIKHEVLPSHADRFAVTAWNW
jgi:hypothetical protein